MLQLSPSDSDSVSARDAKKPQECLGLDGSSPVNLAAAFQMPSSQSLWVC